MSTAHIENVLLTEQRAGQLLVAIHPRREFLRTISAGLLAFDGEGRLSALNARAQLLLAGLDAQRGSAFEQLFGEPFGGFVARISAQGEVRLNDRLGSALVARWVGPRAASIHPAPGPAGAADTGRLASAAPSPTPAFVAEDRAVADALHAVQHALGRAVPVLVRGETGSGKERLVREAIAACGLGGRLTALRCAALTIDRLTGPIEGSANEPSVLLLDEVGELPPSAQAALLAWLDDRVGDAGRGVRVIATTQHDLAAAVAARRFRADLLYRLQGVGVSLPPLRQRSDFGACARHVLARIAPRAHLEPRALELLKRQPWPGNWRELQSVLTRAWYDLAAPTNGTPVLIDVARLEGLLQATPAPETHVSVLQQETTARVLREWERQGGSISATARRLGISRNTVYRHLREAERRRQDQPPDPLR